MYTLPRVQHTLQNHQPTGTSTGHPQPQPHSSNRCSHEGCFDAPPEHGQPGLPTAALACPQPSPTAFCVWTPVKHFSHHHRRHPAAQLGVLSPQTQSQP